MAGSDVYPLQGRSLVVLRARAAEAGAQMLTQAQAEALRREAQPRPPQPTDRLTYVTAQT
jgi:glycerol-3-phosphate dehydrogenase